MIGIVGTAAAQALVALVGFVIAGVPGALLLAAGTFFLSLVPGRAAADVGRRGLLAVPAGRQRLGHLHGAVGPAGDQLGG
jgi:hypothetical protein